MWCWLRTDNIFQIEKGTLKCNISLDKSKIFREKSAVDFFFFKDWNLVKLCSLSLNSATFSRELALCIRRRKTKLSSISVHVHEQDLNPNQLPLCAISVTHSREQPPPERFNTEIFTIYTRSETKRSLLFLLLACHLRHNPSQCSRMAVPFGSSTA